MKTIRIFELFAGIGSQYKACKNIEKELNIKVESIGACEWYIDAIIAYMLIHYGSTTSELELSKERMCELLSNYSFSADSKHLIRSSYFNNMKLEKLQSYFPYLYGFVNNEYFKKKWKTNQKLKFLGGGGRNTTPQTLKNLMFFLKILIF
ncbi:DNA (cytosine-5-)-methyltransferase N-terminal subunit [Mycoplasma capricolum]|uniref:DNA (cytosine-5-)-methyltransferase N-terminal subunit n=1 Tax=Mycoplasma capricolum TaxID=2095 RepID=UPI003DA51F19